MTAGDADGADSAVSPFSAGRADRPLAHGDEKTKEMDGNKESGGKEKASRLSFLQRLSLNEWLTALVGLGSLVVGFVSLIVSYQTYELATDTSDLKSAVGALASLATETHRQANSLQDQLEQMKAAAAQEERAIAATNKLSEEAAISARESKRLADAAIVGNQSTKKLADAAIEANGLNKQSASYVRRAFIVVKGAEFKPGIPNDPTSLWFEGVGFQNIGGSPTLKLKISYRCLPTKNFDSGADLDTLPTIKFPMETADVRTQTFNVAATQEIHPINCALWEDTFQEIRPPAVYIEYVYGTIIYRDTFSASPVHVTEFCYITNVRIKPDPFGTQVSSAGWLSQTDLCPTHNCYDDECSTSDQEDAEKQLGLQAVMPPSIESEPLSDKPSKTGRNNKNHH